MKSKINNGKIKTNQKKISKKNHIIILNKKIESSPKERNIRINNLFTYLSPRNNKNKNKTKLAISPRTNSPNSDIKKYLQIEKSPIKNNQNKKYLEINDLLGEDLKKPINLIFNNNSKDINLGKISNQSYGRIQAYAANTNKGIIRNYNEDRVSIIINMNQPENYTSKGSFPKISYFGIFDGHGGSKCSEYLRNNLLKLICTNKNFPSNINLSIKEAFKMADEDFLKNYSFKNGKMVDFSGSCGIFLLLINNTIYIANLGDSRCLISSHNGKIKKQVTRDHKPNYFYEKERIVNNGGIIYQSKNLINIEDKNKILKGKILVGPHRVLPGKLSVSRTIGDPQAKLKICGGLPNIVINEPDIYCFNIDKDNIDYFILGSDGIFDQLTNQDIFECVSLVYNRNIKLLKNKENQYQKKDLHITCGEIINLILNASIERKSLDNVTCIIVCFKDILNLNKKNNKINYINNINKIKNLTPSKSYRIISDNFKYKKLNKCLFSKNIYQKNYSFRRKNKNKIFNDYSDKNSIPNQINKIIRINNNKSNNNTIFNISFNKKTDNRKDIFNSNKKIESYKKISNNKIRHLNNSNSLKYISFSEKYKNNSFPKKFINISPIKIELNSNKNILFTKNNTSTKVIKTDENFRRKNKHKKLNLDIIFNNKKFGRNFLNNKNDLNKRKTVKTLSRKSFENDTNPKKYKLIKKRFDSPYNYSWKYSAHSSKNFNKKPKEICNIQITSINLNMIKNISNKYYHTYFK